jgi:hypothetical protein
MTISALRVIESCPLRWALTLATYDTIATSRYPARLTNASFQGQVVHHALEVIVRKIVTRKEPSPSAALMELGGYSRILADSINHLKSRYIENPRAENVLASIVESATHQVGQMREQLQLQLQRLDIESIRANNVPSTSYRPQRHSLPPGVYPEVELIAEELHWKGRADLLNLTSDTCDLTDFKTGAPRDEDKEQIQIYSLLWEKDRKLNPERRPTTSLCISYGGLRLDVAILKDAERNQLSNLLMARTEKALVSIASCPPTPTPSAQVCPGCAVRQLCESYWSDGKLSELRNRSSANSTVADLQIELGSQRTGGTWDIQINASTNPTRSSALLCLQDPHVRRFRGHEVGARFRILECYIQLGEDSCPLVTLSPYSEVYALTS